MAHIKKLESKNKGTRYRAQVFAGKRGNGSKRMIYATFDKEKQALAWARDQETAHGKGTLVEGKATIGALLDDLLDYYKQKRKGQWAPLLIETHLRPFFGSLRADQLTTSELNRYIRERQAKVKDATINGELATLRRAFVVAMEITDPPKVNRIPRIPRFKPSDPRQGFFEDAEYRRLLQELPDELKPFLTYAYFTGSRKMEILSLLWSEVDFDTAQVRLPGTKTKTKKPRTIPLGTAVLESLKMQKAIRDQYWPTCPWVFFRHGSGKHLLYFRTAWESALKRAGLWDSTAGKLDAEGNPQGKPTRLIHDLRRTAVRTMTRSGVRDSVAMAISGHKSRAIFDRYDITNERDLADAMRKVDSHITEKRNTNGLQNPQEPENPTPTKSSNMLN